MAQYEIVFMSPNLSCRVVGIRGFFDFVQINAIKDFYTVFVFILLRLPSSIIIHH